MFKRVTKKQQKRQEDEELGLDEDTKQMFGLQDTDSDESSSSDSELDDDLDRGSAADMKTEWLAAGGVESDVEDEAESDEDDLDLESMDDEPPIPLKEALKDPIYHVSSENDDRACIACPKKLLKNEKMVQLHIASAAHIRRFKKFCELAEDTKNRQIDPRHIASSISQTPTTIVNTEGLSNRGLKRKQKLDSIKQKREKTKQIIERKKRKRAKKDERDEEIEGKNDEFGKAATSLSDKPISERASKRRRVSIREASHENDSSYGGVSRESDDRSVMNAGEQATKSSKTESKAIGKSRGEGKARVKANESEVPKPKKGRAEAAESTPNVKIFIDDGSTNQSDGTRSMKKRDSLKLRTKGHMGKAGAGKFAKLSDTRAVKDKSKRKSRSGSEAKQNTDRVPQRATRYFDEPEDGTRSKELGPKKSSAKKTKPEGKNLNGPAKRGGNLIRKGINWKEKAVDDLVIFE